ncbi:uncharacterized protein LOC125946122 [Dermacentor silvarum]|uniref:uncharacterized protein LOC125946122 n=1 Tax=Dermacentor silvarum TaxID=543639 RepID=UPI0021012375|nr:uncharacterized protein LOC125946122 [Dermacentor silvarum]
MLCQGDRSLPNRSAHLLSLHCCQRLKTGLWNSSLVVKTCTTNQQTSGHGTTTVARWKMLQQILHAPMAKYKTLQTANHAMAVVQNHQRLQLYHLQQVPVPLQRQVLAPLCQLARSALQPAAARGKRRSQLN